MASDGRFPGWLSFFAPAPAIPAVTDPARVEQGFRRWRLKVLFWATAGYAVYYFVRKNLSVAMPIMEQDLHITTDRLGLVLTLHGVLYGISKFIHGFFGDRCNARSLMVVGLVASAVFNVMFGFSSTVFALGFVWMLNGWVQGMGFPPCARLLTHWFSPKQLPSRMSIWNVSHCLGAIIILILCGSLVAYGWRICFFVPAAIAIFCAAFLWFTLPDTPPSVGLPEVEGTQQSATESQAGEEFSTILLRHVFTNKYVWLVAIANFFVYALRYAVFDWGPTILTQAKHIQIKHAAWMVAGFEASGAIGALLGGWLTSRFFGGRPMRACVFFMVFALLSIFSFWKFSSDSKTLNTALLCSTGFFIYGPQCLIGIAAANLATKRAAATAVGLTGLFGYLSTVLSGWGLGTLVKHHGWDAGFFGLVIIAAIGIFVFALAWPAKAHGYEITSSSSTTDSGRS
jgi:OPA family glycerol-3-phosphate transporter-like MFS transporter/OPA family sugar phosphate sensor protein UhpC-like MFS transporter